MVRDSPILNQVWKNSPLELPDVRAIMSAPKLKIVSGDLPIEILEATLALFSAEIVQRSIFRERVTAAEWERVRKAFVELKDLQISTALVIARPPSIPPEYAQKMIDWIAKEEPTKQKIGRPSNDMDKLVFSYLLGFYSILSDQKPAATVNGPTERFISEFYARMRQKAKTFEWLEESIVDRPDLKKIIPITKDERIRNRIRSLKDDGINVMVAVYIKALYEIYLSEENSRAE